VTSGLEHYWALDETSGALAVDSVGGWESPVIGDPEDDTIVSGWIGNGRDLGAVVPFAAIELWNDVPDPEYVFERWTFGAAFRLPVGYVGGTDLYYSESATTWLWVYVEPGGGQVHALAGEELNYTRVTWTLPEGTLFDDAWHLVHVTGNGTTIRLFVDGEERDAEPGEYEFRPKSDGDGSPTLGWDFGGILDEAQIWSRAIAVGEHAVMWDGGEGLSAIEYAESIVRVVPEGIDGVVLIPRYYCDIEDGILPPLRVPIRSWQATVQKDRASYVQAVVPGIDRFIDDIEMRDSPEFVIRRSSVFPDGTEQGLFELARAPMTLEANTGWLNNTGTLTGYAQMEPPVNPLTRVLSGARSVASSGLGNQRVRARLDFVVRPGDIVNANGVIFEVAYINFYVTDTDEYMDLGSRAL